MPSLLSNLKFIVFITSLLLVGCDEPGESPPEPLSSDSDLVDGTHNGTDSDNNSVTDISLGGESGELNAVSQQVSGQNLQTTDVVSDSFSNAQGSLRTTSTGEGNFTLGLTAIDPDGLTQVILYVPSVTRSFLLCPTDCGNNFQATITGISPHLMGASAGPLQLALYVGDELDNRVLADTININWQPIQIPSPNVTRSEELITVSWQTSPALIRYNLYAATQQGVNANDILTLDNGIQQLAIEGNNTQFTDADFSKEYQILLTGINAEGESASAVILSIPRAEQSTNIAPSAQDDQYVIDEEQILINNVLENDSDANAQFISLTAIVELPSNGDVEFDASGEFVYTPEVDFFGEDSFVYQITDSEGATTQAKVDITISNVSDSPTTIDDTFILNADFSLTIDPAQLLANDVDVDGDELQILNELVTQPSFGSVEINSDGTFTYTANTNFNDSDSFIYQVSDSQGNVSQASIYILLNTSDHFPIAEDDFYQTNEDERLALSDVSNGVLANDSDPNDRTFQIDQTLVEAPENGQVTLSQDGTFSYFPNTDFFGIDTFLYRITNSAGNIAKALVTIDVIPQMDAPVANDDNYQVNEDDVLDVLAQDGLLQNDYDPDLGAFYIFVNPSIAPAQGSVLIQNDGSFSYTPNADFTGVDSFSYQIVNNYDFTSTGQVFITVNNVNDDPLAQDDVYVHSDGTVLTIDLENSVLINDSDIDGDALTVDTTPVENVSWGTLQLNADGTFTYWPGEGSEDSFTYKVIDSNGGSSEATVTITPFSQEI